MTSAAVSPQFSQSFTGRRDQLVVVSCYTRFDNLAHGPRGKEAKHGMYTFWLDPADGQMVLLSVATEPIMNPAFSRFHPSKNLLYCCTESVLENGEVVSWQVSANGRLTKLGSYDAGGTSTCYITLDKAQRNMLLVNYWDSTIPVLALDEAGLVSHTRSVHDPKAGKSMVAKSTKHVNHSMNDASAQKERQADPHSHAVILDPVFGRIAFVPDLGQDLVRQFLFDPDSGTLTPAGVVKSGPEGRAALDPRYIEFHPTLPVAYVVNELSSEVSVFHFDKSAAENLVRTGGGTVPTLQLLQTVNTIPDGFPGELNTCGRIAVHSAGYFVLCSNRGHDSIVVFAVQPDGLLSLACVQHTAGATPRHFQFDASGQWLIAANQDSNSVNVFQFNMATGALEWTKNSYYVPSPNFVCCLRPHAEARL